MKNILKKIVILSSILIIYGSCETVDFDNINDDPNGPTVAIPSQLLAQAQKYVGGTENNSNGNDDIEGVLTRRGGLLYVQHITQGQYPSWAKYSVTELSYNQWYTSPLQNLNEIIKVNESSDTSVSAGAFGDNNNQIAVAKLLRAYILNFMTDSWGYLPWSEAFQGIQGSQPKFDSQESIYNYMFDEIDQALALINSNAGPSGDVMFNGDMSKWTKFGNTLKLIMALRISDVKPGLAKIKFEAAVASGNLINSNADNLMFTYTDSEESDNPWEDRFESRKDYILSETMVNFLQTNSDPRLPKFANPSSTGNVFVGAPNGKVNGNVDDFSFITSDIINKQTYSAPIYTLAQTKLSLAEAALKGWNVGGGSAPALFKEGIEASMLQWGVDQADVDAYTAAHTSSTITDIAYEKWVALFLNGTEAWAEWRRLDAPVLTPSTFANLQVIPVRHSYSSSVGDNNPDNYLQVISDQGLDDNFTKLWWDIN